MAATPEPVARMLAPGQVCVAGADLWLTPRGEQRVSVPLVSASGDADESRAWRHEARLVVPSSVPLAHVALGTRARLRASRVGSDGRTYWVPLVTGPIVRRSSSLGGGSYSVTVRSPEWAVACADFVRTERVSGAALIECLRLIREAVPDAYVHVDARVRAVNISPREYEAGAGLRIKAVQELAAAMGASFFATPGGTLTLAPLGTARDRSPDWVIETGRTLTSAAVDEDDERYANVVVVSNRDGDTTVSGIEWARPGMAGYVGDAAVKVLTGSQGATGDLHGRGLHVRHESLPVTTNIDAWAAARAIYEGLPREVRHVSVEGLDNPWVTAGSRLWVTGDRLTSWHAVTSRPWAVPSAPMSFESRR